MRLQTIDDHSMLGWHSRNIWTKRRTELYSDGISILILCEWYVFFFLSFHFLSSRFISIFFFVVVVACMRGNVRARIIFYAAASAAAATLDLRIQHNKCVMRCPLLTFLVTTRSMEFYNRLLCSLHESFQMMIWCTYITHWYGNDEYIWYIHIPSTIGTTMCAFK